MRQHNGLTVYQWSGSAVQRGRRGHLLPRRERWFFVLTGTVLHLYHYKPRQGLWRVSRRAVGASDVLGTYLTPRPERDAMKRRLVSAEPGTPPPALPAVSTTLAKLPLLREFLTATAYDDGSIRTPGYVWLKNTGAVFEITCFDPDSGTRLPVRAATLDELLSAVEKLLGAEAAPWEADRYLTEQLTKKRRKKGA